MTITVIYDIIIEVLRYSIYIGILYSMASKNYIDVIIDGKIYNIGGFESEAYLQKVASYINNMIMEFKQNENYRMQKMDMQRILLEINIANDYFLLSRLDPVHRA